MARIGRNEPCPCGSGNKYKKCCLARVQAAGAAAAPAPPSGRPLGAALDELRRSVAQRQAVVRQLGVFVLFATAGGDAWLLEGLERDALRIADQGRILEVSVEEKPGTIEIVWSHHFVLDQDGFLATPYAADLRQSRHADYPVARIRAALKGIGKRMAGVHHVLHSETMPEAPAAAEASAAVEPAAGA
ncbi:MAG: SEC-C metal-binding domain-containing protein [Thermodesulfobacteriota bacterium]